MRLFAIADLHLGFAVGKTMDRFGLHWVGHVRKIAQAWEARIADDDLVLVSGDLSWANKTSLVAADLEWLDGLPGRKIIIKGNHDFWWPKTRRKLDGLLPPTVTALDREAIRVGPFLVAGGRGADLDPPWAPQPAPDADRKRVKALDRLDRSLAAMDALKAPAGTARIAMLHYPPFAPGQSVSVFTERLEAARIDHCVFGHLHTEEDFEAVFQGRQRGVTYRLTSCDYLGFVPLGLEA